MNANIDKIARSFGLTAGRLLDSRLDFKDAPGEAFTKLDRWFDRTINGKHGDGQRLDATQRRDGLAAFTTSALAQQLAPVTLPSRERVPGMTGEGGPLLPIRQTIPLGKERVEWDVIAHTGEAREVGKGGLSGLKFVGEEEDRKFQEVGMYGIGWRWDQFDLWRQVHLGRNLPEERRGAANKFMMEKAEEYGSYGNTERKIPGFFNHSASFTLGMPKSFGDPTLTADELWDQLSIIDCAWSRANPRRDVSGVIMPKLHRERMMRIFKGQNEEGVNAWKFALEAYPWLANIVLDDRMLTASQDGGPMWQLWSNDGQMLWRETSASPMLFGPFNTSELQTMFIALQQDGGVINRLPQLILRINQPG
jgi:hypothetical protein